MDCLLGLQLILSDAGPTRTTQHVTGSEFTESPKVEMHISVSYNLSTLIDKNT